MEYTKWFSSLGIEDIALVGGKNASLAEMYNNLAKKNIAVPNGFATTVSAFKAFLEENNLQSKIYSLLTSIDKNCLTDLKNKSSQIRTLIKEAEFSEQFVTAVTTDYHSLLKNNINAMVAVRSSATAEDLPDASFAGQQESFLCVKSVAQVLYSIKEVFASLFNDRAISYRVHKGFMHEDVAISCTIQLMVESSDACSGVMFTADTETGFDKVVLINASWGLGEAVVQGIVNPDEFYVYKKEASLPVLRSKLGSKKLRMVYDHSATDNNTVKLAEVEPALRDTFCLSEQELKQLTSMALTIEEHYGKIMDIEWAKDAKTGKFYILQAREETVNSKKTTSITQQKYQLLEYGEVITSGCAVGQKIGSGKARLLSSCVEIDKFIPGEILVTDMTDPNWEPIMKLASGIITSRGGRTCHAAIIARELGIPAIVGCTDLQDKIVTGQALTVCCSKGERGYVYNGTLKFTIQNNNIKAMPQIPWKIMLNVGDPERAFNLQSLPNCGVGLARLEFIINNTIGIHPKACLDSEQLPTDIKTAINKKIAGYANPTDFYREKLVQGIATIAAAFYPKKVILRTSDFKTNEYANLIGGSIYEQVEENPMLGYRGAARYLSDDFSECFALECWAIKKVREKLGFTNLAIMIPFVRTLAEADGVINLLNKNGLVRGKDGLKVYMMCEVPSNAILAEKFLAYFDGFSIGSNDLTQLTLGLDRDSGMLTELFNEEDPAVKTLIAMVIKACKKHNKYIGICGQGPSDNPTFASWLAALGIDSVSLNPDTAVATWLNLAKEHELLKTTV